MKNILLVKGSVRSGRTNDKIIELVQAELKNYPEFDTNIADFSELPLPFLDTPVIPSAEGFAASDTNVKIWTRMVKTADAVIVVTPEYNASTSGVLKNAIDWMHGPWNSKPVALVGYGWSGAASGRSHLTDIFNRLKSQVIEPQAGLSFQKDIELDGTPLNDDTASAIRAVLDAVKETVLERAPLPA